MLYLFIAGNASSECITYRYEEQEEEGGREGVGKRRWEAME